MRRSKMKFRPSLASTKSKSNVSSTASPTPLSPSASQSSISTESTVFSSAPVAKTEPSETPSPAPASACTSTLPDLKPVIPENHTKPLLKPEPTAQVLQPVLAPPPPLIKKPESPKPSARRAKTKFRPSGANKSPSRAPPLNLSLSGTDHIKINSRYLEFPIIKFLTKTKLQLCRLVL